MKEHINRANKLADLLDNKFKLFGFKFGIDPILGLIPGGGDTVSLLLSLYIVWIGIKMELPGKNIVKMIINVALDYIIGLIPLLGDIFDFTFKANVMNLEIINKYLDEELIPGEIVE